MIEIIPTPSFEEEIKAALKTPPARPEFIDSLSKQLIQRISDKPIKTIYTYERTRVWLTLAVVIITLIITAWLVGPQRVLAAIRGLFGYIPGVGIVDQSLPIRVLAEPVNVTRDEISITVTTATLSKDKTHIEYRIFGVPASAYPSLEDVSGCITPEYLRLPNGARLERIDNDFAPMPADSDAATFVIPCIMNTLPGKAPENWELPLRFVLAPPDLTPMPVIDQYPTSQPNPESKSDKVEARVTPNAEPITVNRVIETNDGYILVGQFQPNLQPGEQFQPTVATQILDASGKNVAYTIPQDIQIETDSFEHGGLGWAFQIKSTDLVFPLTIVFTGVEIESGSLDTTTEFSFNPGFNPQPGQEWQLDQDVQLAGHTLKVASIQMVSQNAYSFTFEADPKVFGADLQIVGYTPNGGGGGGGGGLADGQFTRTLSFEELPTGTLTVRLSNLSVIGEPIEWKTQWTPDQPHSDFIPKPTAESGLCLSVDKLAQLKPPTDYPSIGKALVFDKLEPNDVWGLAIYSLDGIHKQNLTTSGNWGALSPDGSQVVYSGTDNSIHLLDTVTMKDQVIPNALGFDIHWSYDGAQIAYIGMGNGSINSAFIAQIDGSAVRQVSTLSYATIIGWSPDNTQLYYAVPFTGGAAWKVYSYSIAGENKKNLFTIENGTPNF